MDKPINVNAINMDCVEILSSSSIFHTNIKTNETHITITAIAIIVMNSH